MEILRVVVGPRRQIAVVQNDGRKRIELTDEQAELIREFVLRLLIEEQE